MTQINAVHGHVSGFLRGKQQKRLKNIFKEGVTKMIELTVFIASISGTIIGMVLLLIFDKLS